MIISTIKQFGFRLRADPEEIPFQYSANVQMKFEKDENFIDYAVVGYYIPPGESEAKLLNINDDGTFTLGPDCFKNRGTLSFSFNLVNSIEEVHLGSIDFDVRHAFGDSSAILPEPEEVWISVVTKVAEDAIKEDVELVKQKAKEASQSALTASEKANETQEYANNANQSAGSASLSASSALTAKNDAIAASNSAIQAKQDAEQSANNAKNSANTALENANKSTKAIETVTQIKTEIENKANDFDNSVQTATTNFDNKVNQANTDLDTKLGQANTAIDTKVQEANTTIDEKVKTATEQAQKATNEANRAEQALENKLDRNQGTENAGKTMVVDTDGNLVVGDSSSKNVYTKEEVDYMLADKMDKPYVPIEITDNATIDDALAGNFKIDKIKGNTYQKVETDIVPTPSRPVPINSRKVKAGDEYVELRSLKETINKFDLGLLSQIDLIPDIKTSYRKINVPMKLKPQVRYKFYYENFIIPALSWLVLNIVNSKGNIIFTAFNVDNSKNNEEIEITGKSVIFNSPADGEIYFSYYVQMYNSDGTGIPQSTEMFKENWFTKYVKNIMLTEESLNQTTYVAPTVRDYKIVDHTNKTSKIVRNVGLFECDFSTVTSTPQPGDIGTYRYNFMPSTVGSTNHNNGITGFSETAVDIRLDTSPTEHFYCNSGLIAFWSYTSDLKIKSNVIAPLKTPTEESIPYLEDDTSEVGLSWQDTTSPSPTIESPIRPVEQIDILKTGNNLFDLEKAKKKSNWVTSIKMPGYTILMIKVIKGKQYTFSHRDKLDLGLDFYAGIINAEDLLNNDMSIFVYHKSLTNLIKNSVTFTAKSDYIALSVNNTGFDNMLNYLQDIQLELGDTRTTYEPYKEQHVNITLPQPLYENDVANVESGEYEYENMKYIVTGDEYFRQDYPNQAGYFGRYFDLKNGNGIATEKIWCNYLPYIKSSWSLSSEGCCQNARSQIHLKFSNDRLGITDNTSLEEKRLAFANYLKQLYASENPLYVVVKVVKTTQPIPEEDLVKLKSLKTNVGVNNIFINGEVKPTIEARYPRDLALVQQQLEQKILLISDSLIDTQAKLLLQGGN